jgi:tetratricopeptide (TPR) repeat protein
MRLPSSRRLPPNKMRILCLVALGLLYLSPNSLFAQMVGEDRSPPASTRERLHQSLQWDEVARHLPNPATATPRELEQQGDILRVRRFPEDALDYYNYALARGGNVPSLLNKLGLTELEMGNVALARPYFLRVVKLSRNSPDAWNNFGAVEFLDGEVSDAISDYKRSIKLNKRQAIFHANLANAYFKVHDYGAARREIGAALKLDSQVFERRIGTGGVVTQVLSAQDRTRFCFEMARLYERNGLIDQMLHSLAMASEAGMDVQREMHRDQRLVKFEDDPRVVVLVHNALALRSGRATPVTASSTADPATAPLAPQVE